MIWLLFSLLNAFFESLKDVFGKKALQNINEYVVAWSRWIFAFPFVLIALYFSGIPEIGDEFWKALLIGSTLNIATAILYMKAIKHSDLSVTIPIVTFTPLFLLLTSPIIVNEIPSGLGIAGVALIVFGSYILNLKHKSKGLLAPIKAIYYEKGPRLMLAVAMIWSITANFDKIGIQNSSPIFWVAAVHIFLIITLFPIMIYKCKKPFQAIRTQLKPLTLLGLFSGLSIIFQMIAMGMTFVAYAISVKRTSAIMSVIWGAIFFKEKGIRERLVGAIIMVVGVVLITIS